MSEPPPEGYASWNGRLLAEVLHIPADQVWPALRCHRIQLQRDLSLSPVTALTGLHIATRATQVRFTMFLSGERRHRLQARADGLSARVHGADQFWDLTGSSPQRPRTKSASAVANGLWMVARSRPSGLVASLLARVRGTRLPTFDRQSSFALKP